MTFPSCMAASCLTLRADTTRNGYRLPSRIEFSWAALQDDFAHVGEDDSVDVGFTVPNWRLIHIALGGDYLDVSSATQDYRMPLGANLHW